MFYNRPNGFRSSVRGGASQNNRHSYKPYRNNGGFNQTRGSGRGLHESKLKGQIDIFIKKAENISAKIEIVSVETKEIVKRRENLDYVGQMAITVIGQKLLTRKILRLSDIIMIR